MASTGSSLVMVFCSASDPFFFFSSGSVIFVIVLSGAHLIRCALFYVPCKATT